MTESVDVYRLAFEQSDRGLALVSLADVRFIDVNERFCTLVRRDRDELAGSQWSLIAGMHDPDTIKSKIETYAGQLGEPHCCDISVSALLDGDTSPSIVLIEVRNITEQRASELKSRLRAEELEALVDAVPAAIWLAHDTNGERISVNHVAREWIQMPEEVSFLDSDTRVQEAAWWGMADADGGLLDVSDLPLMRAARGEIVNNFEGQVILSDGQKRHIFGNSRPLLDANGKPRGAVSALVDITDHKRAEVRERLLAREVNHRARNILSVVQAIVQLTKATSIDAFRQGLTGRIGSLARVHTLISDSSWSSVDLWELAAAELAPFGFGDSIDLENQRVSISGPDIALKPFAAQALALTLHELATNAAKYGALNHPSGKLRIDWCLIGDRADEFSLTWWEYHSRPTSNADHNGFGATLIRTSVEDQLSGKLLYSYLDDGLKVEICCPIDAVTDPPPPGGGE